MLKHSEEQSRFEYYVIDLDGIETAWQEPNQYLVMSDGNGELASACIRCVNPQCMYYFDEEYVCEAIPGFSSSSYDEVCAYGAIGWTTETHEISIKSDKCIGCGLCARRCPFGSIAMHGDKPCVNTDRSNWRYEVITQRETAEVTQANCSTKLKSLTKERVIREISLLAIEAVYEGMFCEGNSNEANLRLCRNLMIAVGANCALARTGDVYTRADAVYCVEEFCGAIEIEFGEDTLSVARNILDDVAMMQVRNNVPVANNHPIALLATMPNTRQNYYALIDDISKILNIEVATVTIAALLMLTWSGVSINLASTQYKLGFRETSIQDSLEKDITQLLGSTYKGTGMLEAKK